MSTLRVSLDLSGLSSADMERVRGTMENREEVNARIAGDSEKWVKKHGKEVAAGQHRTANKLGAAHTDHLRDAYNATTSRSDATGAELIFPRASRLRAAFGRYVCKPKGGKKYLTIPAIAEAYGRSARDFQSLKFGFGKKGPSLGQTNDGKWKTFYYLVRQAEIPEDTALIPFEELGEKARISAEQWFLDKIESLLPAA